VAAHAARPSRHRTQHDRRGTARCTTVAAPHAAASSQHRGSSTVSAPTQHRRRTARGTAVAAPHAARSSRHRTSDHHRPRLCCRYCPHLHTATTVLASTPSSPPLYRCYFRHNHHRPPLNNT